MKLKQMIKIGKDVMVKYSPNILTAAGVVLFGVTVYLAVKKTDPVKKILKDKGITVCEDYFYAHMLNIDGKIEAAKEFGKKMNK